MANQSMTKAELLAEVQLLKKRIADINPQPVSEKTMKTADSFQSVFSTLKSRSLIIRFDEEGKNYSIEKVTEVRPGHNGHPVLSELPEGCEELIRKVYRSGIAIQKLLKVVTGNGAEWLECHAVPVTNQLVHLLIWDVSDLNSQIEGFSKNELEIAQIKDNIPIGIFRISRKGIILNNNRWFSKIFKYRSPKELLRMNLADLFEIKKKGTDFIRNLSFQGKAKETEVELMNREGAKIWAVISAKAHYDNDGKIEGFDGYIYDISERKVTLERIRDNDELFMTVAQNMKSALYIFNKEGQFIYANPGIKKVTGYSVKEILQKKFFEIVHPEFVDLVKKRGFNRVLGKNVQKNYELKIITKSGEERWIEIFGTRMFYKGEHVVLGVGNDVTDRKNALEVIKQSEEKYKSLYSFFRLMADNVPDMIWAKDLRKRYIFVNKSICENLLLAKDTSEPIGKTDRYFSERARQKNKDNPDWYTFGDNCPDSDDEVIRTKRSGQFDEYGNIKGEFLFLDVKKSPLWSDDGTMIGTVGSARNVTEARQNDDKRLKEEKIRNIVYRIGNAVNTTKDLSELFTVIRLELNKVIDTTNLFISLYDKEKDELTLPYYIDEKDRFKRLPARKTLTRYVIRNNTPVLLHEKEIMDLVSRDEIELVGTMAKVWLGVPLLYKGETIGAIVVQNYTDEKAFGEEDLELLKFVSVQISISISQKKADDALRENEFTLRQIIDNVPVMIYAKDRNLKFILANKALASAYGKRVDEIEGRLQSDLHPDKNEVDKFTGEDLRVLQSGEVKVSMEEEFTDIYNNKRVLQTIKIPMKAGSESGIALLGVAIDITERINFEVELKHAKNKAEEADRLKTAFLANMSHEIRTPMNAIIGFSELLNDKEITEETRHEFINLINESSKILLNLIEDIIDVAKIEAEQLKIVKGTCQVNIILDELKNNFEAQLKKSENKKIALKVIKTRTEPYFSIYTDPLRFKQIMNNLIGNAFKFTEKGCIEFGYEITDEKTIMFYVKDTGIGLTDDKLSFIFERFRQAEESSTKEYGGTGLGLTISRRLVEILGGKIWVESVFQKGSTFYFTLPYEEVKIEDKEAPTLHNSQNFQWKGNTILVAEDELSNYELIEAVLQNTNVKIVRAVNGEEAVNNVRTRGDVDLVLMDIRMPVMNGYEATRKIKSMKEDLPVISLTAYAMADDRDKSLMAGCDDHITKPLNPKDLLNKINYYLTHPVNRKKP